MLSSAEEARSASQICSSSSFKFIFFVQTLCQRFAMTTSLQKYSPSICHCLAFCIYCSLLSCLANFPLLLPSAPKTLKLTSNSSNATNSVLCHTAAQKWQPDKVAFCLKMASLQMVASAQAKLPSVLWIYVWEVSAWEHDRLSSTQASVKQFGFSQENYQQNKRWSCCYFPTKISRIYSKKKQTK